MPTINQLTKKSRTKKNRKSKSPVLLVGKIVFKRNKQSKYHLKKEEYVLGLVLLPLRSQTQH